MMAKGSKARLIRTALVTVEGLPKDVWTEADMQTALSLFAAEGRLYEWDWLAPTAVGRIRTEQY